MYFESVFIKTVWNIFSVCLSRSAESATETISLALHSVSHALKPNNFYINIYKINLSKKFMK